MVMRAAAPDGRGDRRRAGDRDECGRAQRLSRRASGAMRLQPWPSCRSRASVSGPSARPTGAAGSAAQALEAGRGAALSDDELIALAGALPRHAVVAVGGARHLAGPEPDRLSGEPLHPGLFLRLRQPHHRGRAACGASSATTGRARCRSCGARPWSPAGLGVLGTADRLSADHRDPDWFYAFVPPAWPGRDPRATAAALPKTLFSSQRQRAELFATFLFTHNAQIALFAFRAGLCLLPADGLPDAVSTA